MKKKTLSAILAFILCVVCSLFCFACSNGSSTEGNGTSDGSSSECSGSSSGSEEEPPEESTEEEEATADVIPTKAQVVEARQSAASQAVQGYDFTLTLTGDFSVLGHGTSLSGVYDGAYRYNETQDDLSFKRTTSGALLIDSTLYMFSAGDNRIKMTMKNGEVKKLEVEAVEEQNITMVNLPVVALVDSVKEANIVSVEKTASGAYPYSCKLAFDRTNAAYNLLNRVMGKLDTGVSFKGIDLSLDTGVMQFKIADGKINDFKLAFEMDVEVKGLNVAVTFEYEQQGASSQIQIPSSTGIAYSAAQIQSTVTEINGLIDDVKDDPVYAIGLTAENELDPGWNKLAIKDSYQAKMYKKTDSDGVWFNHSYCYKSHSETDGRESYKYTLGNVNGSNEDNRGVWLISRKGTNEQTRAEGVTADTQFDFLTSMVKQQATAFDCVKKQVSGNQTVYTLYLNRMGTAAVQQKILDMINTNGYGDVIEVNNYFNTENTVVNAEIEICAVDGKIASAECKTELRYTPTGGEYTEYNVTLNNTVKLEVNAANDFEKACDYFPPTKVKGTLGFGKNLNDSEYYIA